MTAEEVREKAAMGIEDLINKNQRIPGSIRRALLDRLPYEWAGGGGGGATSSPPKGRRRKDI